VLVCPLNDVSGPIDPTPLGKEFDLKSPVSARFADLPDRYADLPDRSHSAEP